MKKSKDIKNVSSNGKVLDSESENNWEQEEILPTRGSKTEALQRKYSEESSDFFLFVNKCDKTEEKNEEPYNSTKNEFLMYSTDSEVIPQQGKTSEPYYRAQNKNKKPNKYKNTVQRDVSSNKGSGFENVVSKRKGPIPETKDNDANIESEHGVSEESNRFNNIMKIDHFIPTEVNRNNVAQNKLENSQYLSEKPDSNIHLLEKSIVHPNNNEQHEFNKQAKACKKDVEHTDKKNEDMNAPKETYSIANIWEIAKKKNKSNSDLLITILDIGFCCKKYNYSEGENSTKEFWVGVLKHKVFENIFKKFKPETLRKYFYLLDKVENPNKVEKYIEIIRKYKCYLNLPTIKLLTVIRCISTFINNAEINFQEYFKHFIKYDIEEYKDDKGKISISLINKKRERPKDK